MKRIIFTVMPLFLILVVNLKSQFVVSDLSDLPDLNELDGKFEPKTLRSAIQNASRIYNVPQTITLALEFQTIEVSSDLPPIANNNLTFDGRGLILKPAANSTAKIGLWIGGNKDTVRKIMIQGFSSYGIIWEGSDGLLESTISRDNGVNLHLWHAHRNMIGREIFRYYSNSFYGGKNNVGSGINITDNSEDNIIQYCSIGIDENSTVKPNLSQGINVEGYRTIIRNNYIGGNKKEGIRISYGNIPLLTHIINNSIGIDLFGTVASNNSDGIHIIGSSGDSIINNIISGNSGAGVSIDAGKNIVIENNKIGTDKTTKISIPNNIGLYLRGSDHKVRNNVVSGNLYDGISVDSPNSLIQLNIVGLDSAQQIAVPNKDGISVNCSNIVIGDTVGNNSNIVAGNKRNGIMIVGVKQKNITVCNNMVGINKKNDKKFANKGSGVFVSYNVKDVNVIFNVISSCGEHGVRIERDVVEFNDGITPTLYRKPINIDIAYNSFIGEFGGSGISIFNADSIYIYNNSIEDAKGNGISIENDSTRFIRIFSNQIGPKVSIPIEQKIDGDGVYIHDAKSVYIGGKWSDNEFNTIINCKGNGISSLDADSVFVKGNDILGVGLNGVSISGITSRYIRILRNRIGPDKDTLNDNRIYGDGIFVEDAKDVLIGSQVDPTENNTIKYCQEYGVSVHKEAEQVYVLGNSMIDNKKGGISLDILELYFVFGYSYDSLDIDKGPNGMQNTPEMKIAKAVADSVIIKGVFHGFANTVYRIDTYLAKKLDESDKFKTQGSIYLHWFTIKTNNVGIATIDTSWSRPEIATYSTKYPFVTLTASGVEGTSSFSNVSSSDVNLYTDIKVKIDTANSLVDNDGNVKLVGVISNIGTAIATTVSLRDTIPNFDIKDMYISKGVIGRYDSTIVATIPLLSPGESVIYTSYGKAANTGVMKRKVKAISSEVDLNIQNNSDSISFTILKVNNQAPSPKYPIRNEKELNNPLRIIWYSLKDAYRYHLQVSKGKFGSLVYSNPNFREQASVLIVDDSTLNDTSFIVRNLEGNQTYYWRVRGINKGSNDRNWCDTLPFTSAKVTEVFENEIRGDVRINLIPNPIKENAEISIYNDKTSTVSLAIIDIVGVEKFTILDNCKMEKGEHILKFNSSTLSNGLYYLRLINADYVVSKPLIIIH